LNTLPDAQEVSVRGHTMRPMPGRNAKIGDAYWVNRDATEHPARVGKPARPMACVAERPTETAWTGVPRVTSDIKPEDAPSRAMPEVDPNRLNSVGAWSLRYLHPVHKQHTGTRGMCDFLGPLPDDERKVVMTLYRDRLR
jgi:hypothetical protein